MYRPDHPHGQWPVAIIGAGPIGLAAAAHLAERGLTFTVLEAADKAGAAIGHWHHVRLFSPWRYLIDRAAARLLQQAGWTPPPDDELPTGADVLTAYLQPLAALPALKPHIRYGAKVVSVGRTGLDKVKSHGRERQPFELRLTTGERLFARAVLDASGTWFQPNPVGSGGIPAVGEAEIANHIAYGIPDSLGDARQRYAGKRVLVVGGGHSAMNNLLNLLTLADQVPATAIHWGLRSDALDKVYGGGTEDALPARGALGLKLKEAVDNGRLRIAAPFRVTAMKRRHDGIHVQGSAADTTQDLIVDEIIASTGFRPDTHMLREIRVDLDPWLEAPRALAPMIDPNLHSCGTVRPHGALQLRHPEQDFYIVGMKSYGRAPTFLMATGYEQVRSVAAMLAGDVDAAERVELELPETGVCNSSPEPQSKDANLECCAPIAAAPIDISLPHRSSHRKEQTTMATEPTTNTQPSGCCGGPAPEGVDACCVKDADAKAAGEAGCGCSDAAPKAETVAKPQTACCG